MAANPSGPRWFSAINIDYYGKEQIDTRSHLNKNKTFLSFSLVKNLLLNMAVIAMRLRSFGALFRWKKNEFFSIQLKLNDYKTKNRCNRRWKFC